jgi:glutathione peroxidase
MALPDLPLARLDGAAAALADWRGQVLLVVNVASRCGYTPQYAGLEALWRRHRARGFAVLGFPCNQFGAQEPGSAAEIATFCTSRWDVTFPLFAKTDVNGPHTHPLFQWLKSEAPGLLGTEAVKWNFTKFLVGRDGAVLARFGPADPPEAIEAHIVRALEAPPPAP